ncbi:hypothetical protein [Streptomyces purpureus]|uniref:hypothetical protein n=1 Tax=Streptomyces purpureus TaxID=1951 RepID=UPI0003814756|nr:hypothetical protein [Streptomyces purpureus]
MSAKKHTCALCSAPVRKATGEHAVPQQLLQHLNFANDVMLGEDAYDMYAMTRQGFTQKETKKLENRLSAIRIPCCLPCNQWLNETFEKPATHHLPKLLEGRELFTSTQEELTPLSRWIVKTVLMSNHPQVYYTGMTHKAKVGIPFHAAVPGLLNELRKIGNAPHPLSLWAVFATAADRASLSPDQDATISMGVNIVRPDGILKLTVTDSKGMSLAHVDGTQPAFRKLWPLHAGCTSCSRQHPRGPKSGES